jgi:hypothetical protein
MRHGNCDSVTQHCYFVGVHFGQAQNYTGVVVLKRTLVMLSTRATVTYFSVNGLAFDTLERSACFTGKFNDPTVTPDFLQEGMSIRFAHHGGYILHLEFASERHTKHGTQLIVSATPMQSSHPDLESSAARGDAELHAELGLATYGMTTIRRRSSSRGIQIHLACLAKNRGQRQWLSERYLRITDRRGRCGD